ncbi:MAG TPA: hypothetical protein PKD98_16440, partial [Anaerolineae bacterium]|nr:hypothetical protein [Anaerolineae bacterium]
MKRFKDLRIGTKIMSGYIVALILMVGVSGLATVRLSQLSASISNLADNLAEDQHLADQIATAVVSARLYVNRYMRDPNATDLNRFNEEFSQLETLLATAETQITKAERAAMNFSIKGAVKDYDAAFTEVVDLVANRQKTLTEVLDVQAPVAQEKLDQLRQAAVKANSLERTNAAGLAGIALHRMRLNVFKYQQNGDPQWAGRFNDRHQELDAALAELKVNNGALAVSQLQQDAEAAVQAYYQGFGSLRADFDRQQQLTTTKLDVLGPEILQTAQAMSESVSTDFEAARLEAEQ